MNAKIYIDKGQPLFACCEEKLTDGSTVHNIYVRGSEENTR